MTRYTTRFSLSDNGGRRSGIDRRLFSYSAHIPERRCGQERRSGSDRRGPLDSVRDNLLKKSPALKRKALERRIALKKLQLCSQPS